MVKIAIDLGTTNSLITVWKDKEIVLIPNAFNEYLTPSVVSFDDDGIIVGKIAKERLITYPDKTFASFKKFMGTKKRYYVNNEEYSSIDLSSLVIRQLIEDAENFLNEKVDEAIISVPAYFNEFQRMAVKTAGELAGIKVERIINEPTAAALAYRMNYQEDKMFLVFDIGGGTLDISLVDSFENVVEIVAVVGDNNLGGDDFDKLIANYFCKQNNLIFDNLESNFQGMILKKAEKTKRELSNNKEVIMELNYENKELKCAIDEKTLLNISDLLLLKISKLITKVANDAKISLNEIDEVILVGGSSKMKLIQDFVSHLIKKEILNDFKPDTTIVRGLGYVLGIRKRDEVIKDILLTDICPFSLGINVVNYNDHNKPFFSPIIERNSTLPSSKMHSYSTAFDNQERIAVNIFQGEAMYCEDNLKLGELVINVPKAPKGMEVIDVRFTYDINGILEVEVVSKTTENKENCIIINPELKLSKEKIEQRLIELSNLKIHPKDKNENKYVIEWGKRLYEEALGEIRVIITNEINKFEHFLLVEQESRLIEKQRKTLINFFEQIESNKIITISDYYDSFSNKEDEDNILN